MSAALLFRRALAASARTTPFLQHQNFLRPQISPSTPVFAPRVVRASQKMPLVTINQSIVEKLKQEGVIPDVIDEFSPSVFLQAEFPSGSEIQLGNTLEIKDTKDPPTVIITPGAAPFDSESAKYTLCLTDPDAASREDPKWAEFCHWLVTDIKPKSGTLDLKDAKELVEYMGPAPPEKTGKHRYVLLFFKNGKEQLKTPDGRKKWGYDDKDPRVGARYYAKKHGLTLLGANFFFCQNGVQ
ncbi:hypothetical protein DRE_04764 [Drechslerella stenobrocha 248]|uniref:Carboxypeptidase Y inhibitor n=1 Tax=Drechslerella stenobrocha 248 TaxID=1043628 RepID=W7HPE5_9PEZI|nr:hypothetical protein DRE_04764 [Drechslerella stenobrocha 248]